MFDRSLLRWREAIFDLSFPPARESIFALLILFTTACTPATVAPTTPTKTPVQNDLETPAVTSPTSTPLTPITLPLTAYILDDSTGKRSSQRTAAQLQEVYEARYTARGLLDGLR